jgi:hypothetical protein
VVGVRHTEKAVAHSNTSPMNLKNLGIREQDVPRNG